MEAQLATLASRRITLSDEQRHRLLTLGQDLTAVWEHPTASAALKKRLLRTVLHEMLIDTLPEPPEHLLQLHWHGGVHTELRVARHTVGKHGRATPEQALEVIRELSKVCRDQTSAATLNRLGYRTGTGKTWRAHSVACVRYQYRLPHFPKQHDWLTREQAAVQLGVSATVIRRLIAALPRAKGNSSHSLRRLEIQGLIVMTRTPGGKTESVSLTAAGRQKALKRAGSYEEGETIQKNNGLCTDKPPRSYATIRAEGKRVRSKSTRTPIISLGETESRVGCYTGPVSAQPRMASSGKSMLINEV